jgi:hypothetical protein
MNSSYNKVITVDYSSVARLSKNTLRFQWGGARPARAGSRGSPDLQQESEAGPTALVSGIFPRLRPRRRYRGRPGRDQLGRRSNRSQRRDHTILLELAEPSLKESVARQRLRVVRPRNVRGQAGPRPHPGSEPGTFRDLRRGPIKVSVRAILHSPTWGEAGAPHDRIAGQGIPTPLSCATRAR